MIADSLSSNIGVGPCCLYPSSLKIDRRYRACFAAVTAARNSASLELVAVMDCVLERYEMAPPDSMNAYPVVDLRFRRSLACAASTKTCSLSRGTSGNSGRSLGNVSLSWVRGGNVLSIPDRLYIIPQFLVRQRYFATCLRYR